MHLAVIKRISNFNQTNFMRYRTSLAVWATISPIAWIVLLVMVSGYTTPDLGIAIAIAALTLFSLLGSFAAFALWSKSDHFFKSIEKLEDETENAIKARRMYTRKLEELEKVKS